MNVCMNREECVFAMMTYVKRQEPSPGEGEGARSAGEGSPTKCSVYRPHPAFGHPLPGGEGARLVHVTVIANHNSLFDVLSIHSLQLL